MCAGRGPYKARRARVSANVSLTWQLSQAGRSWPPTTEAKWEPGRRYRGFAADSAVATRFLQSRSAEYS